MHAAECRSSLISLGRCDVSAGQPKGFGRSRGIGGDGQRTWEVTGKRGTLKNFYQNIIFYSSSCRKKKHTHFLAQKAEQSLPILSLHAVLYSTWNLKKKKKVTVCMFFSWPHSGRNISLGSTGNSPRRPNNAGTGCRRKQRSSPSCWRESHDPERHEKHEDQEAVPNTES